ncbi:hypothetical protein OIE66_11330 [Nonomuraea sp. NBC_01738]|uniref:hypothetical protein n=1 Tax=Nonomuraea sp. NBC_01738 TaxID=2976003 RepID=UPI002E15A957|nr:hypothetical protein OIE66_11330 [Nonomuraea sp. NBC_01738]
MEELTRTLPFECRGCWHVWEEEYLVRRVDDRYEVWTRDGVAVPPPSKYAICPKCGGGQVTTFPEGYLARHPEARIPAPTRPDESALVSPVRRPLV